MRGVLKIRVPYKKGPRNGQVEFFKNQKASGGGRIKVGRGIWVKRLGGNEKKRTEMDKNITRMNTRLGGQGIKGGLSRRE